MGNCLRNAVTPSTWSGWRDTSGILWKMSRATVSQKSKTFTESVIREMTRLCVAEHGADCVNLAQGFPDFAAPAELKEAAVEAIRQDFNQYATTWGAKVMRDAIADKSRHFRGMTVDPETEITVGCGVTEAMLSTILALVDPGDEVIIFEPFYENYGPDCILSGATPVVVPLVPPDWHFDHDQLRRAFNARTRAIIINTPHNPTGKVYSRAELTFIAGLCQEFDALAITDEIYEHLVYRGEHISIATLDGMRERTVTINGLSKTYTVPGSSFYLEPERGRGQIRFSFPKKMETLRRAADRLKRLQRVA